MLHLAAYLIGANIYDTRVLVQNHHRSINISPRQRPDPLISILIPAYNEEKVIKRCLESLRKSSYKKLQVIVNNDASTDATAKIVRAYKARYPKINIRLVNRRHNAGKASGLNYIAKNYASGDLVMTLDADSVLQKNALKNVIEYFDDPRVMGVAANVRIIEEFSALGLLQRFEHMIGYRSKKLYTLVNCELIIGGVASTYRRSILERVCYYDTDTVTEDIGLSVKIAALGNKTNRLVYAANVVAMTEGVQNFRALLNQRYRWKLGNLQNLIKYRRILFAVDRKYSKTLTWYRMPMAYLGELMLLIEPIILAYVVYLSIRYLNPALILSAYSAITIYLLLIIWPDEHMSARDKLKTSMYVPVMYFIFYIMNLVQVISIFRCLRNKKGLLRISKPEGPWVSPKRSGKAIPAS